MVKNSFQQRLIKEIETIEKLLKEENKTVDQQSILENLLLINVYKRVPKEQVISATQKYLQKTQPQIFSHEDETQSLRDLNHQLPMYKRKNPNKQSEYEPEIKKTQKSTKPQAPLLEELGGFQSQIDQLIQQIHLPLQHIKIFESLNISPPKGTLITGPPGCGKTALGLAICSDIKAKYTHPYFFKASQEIIGPLSGESEKNLKNLFQEAIDSAPSLLFLDEIDSIAGQREKASKEMERRIVSELLSCLDSLPHNVFVIASTSRPESLEAAIRRGGRFDNEIMLGVPDENQRLDMLQKMTKKNPLNENVDLLDIAKSTPGYVPADLVSLLSKAGVNAVQRISQIEEKNRDFSIQKSDFDIAMLQVQPTGKREGFCAIPTVTWDDIGGLEPLKEELKNNIILPILQPEKFINFNITSPAGVLLYGPPGNGKTLLAKAVANASKANFISVKGPELLNKYVGESERSVRQVFQRAKASSPCIIFFDELDALCPKRGTDGNQVTERVVNCLLSEMDGVESRKQVYVIAATNRPDIIDPAMLRGGRLDKLLYVPQPDNENKLKILQALMRKTPITGEVDLLEISQSERTQNFSGADLASLVKEAGLICILQDKQKISQVDLQEALLKIFPSLSDRDRKSYEKLQQNLRSSKQIIKSD